MGNNEEGKPSKAENPSSPAPDHANMHMYPDWAAMQAYYGPRVALPPYYNSAMASGQAPPAHYMWGPQPMMSPYGPYAAVYSHGSVYAHPAIPLGSQSNGHGVPSSPATAEAMAVTPLSKEIPGKSSGNTDRGLLKKLKKFDGLAMSIGNANTDSAEGGADQSQSGDTEGSTESSDGNTEAAGQDGQKGICVGTPTAEGKAETHGHRAPPGVSSVIGATGNLRGMTHSPSTGKLEVKNSPTINTQLSPTAISQPGAVLPPEGWLQSERELKRERRKQSNRESARRSRLRRQAEAEELATSVETLGAENSSLKSEITRLRENLEKLRLENAALMGKLKSAQVEKTEEMLLDNNTENLLSRVSNSAPVNGSRPGNDEGVVHEKNPNSSTRLRQLLGKRRRANAVAAS